MGLIKTDFLVIGGGTIGLPVAVTLAENISSKKVTCIEAGGLYADEEHMLGNPKIVGSNYSGASEGRRFCIGGTSTVWGGALIPLQSRDLVNASWELNHGDLTQYVADVEKLFDLPLGTYDLDEINPTMDSSNSYILRAGKWPSFLKRNTYSLLKDKIARLSNLEIHLNSPAIKMTPQHDKTIVTIKKDSSKQTIHAQNVLICCGAIESTRLVLNLLHENHFKDLNKTIRAGKGFSDHLSSTVGEIKAKDMDALNKEFAFKFEKKGCMRNYRLEMSQDNKYRKELPPHYFHISFVSRQQEKDGYYFLREVFRSIQSRKFPEFNHFKGLLSNIPWIIRMIVWRYYHKRLLRPDNAIAPLNIVLEQSVDDRNRITLDSNNEDAFGNSCPKIEWRVTDQDRKNLVSVCENFKSVWDNSRLAKLGELVLKDKALLCKEIGQSTGIYHPTSSTAFGTSEDFVVDRNMYLRGNKNIQVLSTSVLPTGGGANPTMMALLIAFRCIHQHANHDKKSNETKNL